MIIDFLRSPLLAKIIKWLDITIIVLFLLAVVLGVGLFFYANQELKGIAKAQTENVVGDKNKALALALWFHDANYTFGASLQKPEIDFYTKKTDCIGFSNAFLLMSNSIGLPARIVSTRGEAHSWVEIFSEGRWINLDPFTRSEESYDDPRFYVEKWIDGNYHKRFSYVFWTEENGKEQDITEKYTPVGTLKIIVTKDGNPVKARVTIKSHHLIEMSPKDYKVPYESLTETTNENGIFEKNLGPNNYTIEIERDAIPLPSLIVNKAQKDATVDKNSVKIVEIELGPTLSWGAFTPGYITIITTATIILLLRINIILWTNVFRKNRL